MTWLFLVGGLAVGALVGGIPGALALGFIGWLVGFIVSSLRKSPDAAQQAQSAAQSRAAPSHIHPSLASRLNEIEQRLHAIEVHLGIGAQPAASAAVHVTPAPVSVTPAEAGAQHAAQPLETPQAPRTLDSRSLPPGVVNDSEPNFIVAWFMGGNTIVRVGLLVLFFGLAFLVKYGVEHQMIPVELRVAAVGAAGLALLVIGWRLREKRAGYGLSLQGAGVAVLYLTIFGALRLYHLIPAGMAFFLLVAIAALSAFLAVAQDSLVLAVFGAAGGFMAPILASTGGGDHVMLFSYYLVLTAGIVAIAWYKAWRALNLVGFVFTAIIGIAWGTRYYRPELLPTTEPFLVAFFLAYVAIAILFARNTKESGALALDGTITFGAPIVAFGLDAGMMKDIEFGLAWSAVALSAFYLVLASILMKMARERWHLLAECFLALGVVFGSLAIPLALDARWTSAAWALEGAAIIWVSMRQRRRLGRAFGVLLQVGAAISFFYAYNSMPPGPALLDAVFIGAIIMFAAGMLTHRVMARGADATDAEHTLAPIAFVWSMAWLVLAGVHEIRDFVPYEYRRAAYVAFPAAVALVFAWLGRSGDWKESRWPALILAPLLLFMALEAAIDHAHVFGYLGWLAWIFAIAVHFWLMAKARLEEFGRIAPILHVLGIAFIALVFSLELEWQAVEYTASGTAWALASRIVVPSALVLLISGTFMDTRWPVANHLRTYRIGAVAVLVGAMALWSLHVNFSHAGGSEPLPYMPVLNALDLAHILAIIAIVSAWMAARRSGLHPGEGHDWKPLIAFAGAVAFIWANSMLLRTIHHWDGVPYRFDALMRSVVVQSALSVFWTFLALALMLIATKRVSRTLWVIGATLMGVVVVKLVLIDLSHLAGIERIVSFIGVGVLMLVIGYFAPVPPRKEAT